MTTPTLLTRCKALHWLCLCACTFVVLFRCVGLSCHGSVTEAAMVMKHDDAVMTFKAVLLPSCAGSLRSLFLSSDRNS